MNSLQSFPGNINASLQQVTKRQEAKTDKDRQSTLNLNGFTDTGDQTQETIYSLLRMDQLPTLQQGSELCTIHKLTPKNSSTPMKTMSLPSLFLRMESMLPVEKTVDDPLCIFGTLSLCKRNFHLETKELKETFKLLHFHHQVKLLVLLI